MKKTILLFALFLPVLSSLRAQEIAGEFQSRMGLELRTRPTDNLRLHIAPEVRLGEDFRVDNFHVEGGLEYEPLRGLDLGASYRFLVNPRETKSTEYVNRYALFASYAREIRRWEPSLRVKYTNDSDDAGAGTYLRYRTALKYDIKGVRFTPSVSLEGFHALEENNLYKWRTGVGGVLKINEHGAIRIEYNLDYYLHEYRNRHILELGYRHSF